MFVRENLRFDDIVVHGAGHGTSSAFGFDRGDGDGSGRSAGNGLRGGSNGHGSPL